MPGIFSGTRRFELAREKRPLKLKLVETRFDVSASFGELLDLFSNEECTNYLKNSGYVSV